MERRRCISRNERRLEGSYATASLGRVGCVRHILWSLLHFIDIQALGHPYHSPNLVSTINLRNSSIVLNEKPYHRTSWNWTSWY